MGIGKRLAVLRETDFAGCIWRGRSRWSATGSPRSRSPSRSCDLTGSATDLGIVLATHSLVVTALVLVGGVFADRVSPRIAMLRADLVRIVVVGLIAALLIAGVAKIWQLARPLRDRGRRDRLLQPGLERDRAAGRQRRPAAGGQRAAQPLRSVGKVVGPGPGRDPARASATPGWAIAVDAATFAASAVFLAGCGRRGCARTRRRASFFAELREGWTGVRRPHLDLGDRALRRRSPTRSSSPPSWSWGRPSPRNRSAARAPGR